MDAKKTELIFQHLKKQTPKPITELRYTSPFELLIAVMLSAQATDKGVNLATEKLFPVANTAEKILSLGENKLKNYLKTINYYPTKTKNILRTCQLLLEKHEGQVPKTREELEALPGVGRKTANVILNTAFGQLTIAVDTHVFRVANRLDLAPGKTTIEVEQKLLKVVPKKYLKGAHHWLIMHGRYTCTAKKPRCPTCIIRDLCVFEPKTSMKDLQKH